jgi:hypothetical protein
MKKFFIVAVSALLCICLAGPAMAKVQMGGMITVDTYYINISDEFASGGVAPGTVAGSDSLNVTQMDLPLPLNRLNAKYTSDDGMIGGFIEVRGGGGQAAQTTFWNYAWIDWRFNPNVYLRLGRQTQSFAIHAPKQAVGWNSRGGRHLILVGFGNIHGGSSRDSIRLYWKFNDMIRMEIQAMDPDSDPAGISAANGVVTGPGVAVVAPGAVEEMSLPRFDLALPISVGNWVIEPSFTWLQTSYVNVPGGSDDDYQIYGAAIGVKGGIGPVIIGGEFTYGRNLGGANHAGSSNWQPSAYVDGAGNIRTEDTDGYAWWFHLGFKLGPATIYGIVANQSTDNDGNPGVASISAGGADAIEWDIDRWAYGISVPISVAKGFTIQPEFMYYDYDSDAKIGGIQNTDLGSQWVLGVQWQLTF